MRHPILSLAILAFLCGCDGGGAAPGGRATAATTAPTPDVAPSAAAAKPGADGAPAFAGPVWRVQPGSGVEAGTTYTFLRDGTLAIDAPHGMPARGEWRYEDGKLTMVEDGIAYPTDIVALDDAHFVIRSHNPGGVLEIAMVRDARAASP